MSRVRPVSLLPLAVLIPLVAAAQTTPPAIASGGVVNAADYTAPIAPGGMVGIFGSALSSSTLAAASVPLPKTLAGSSVEVSQNGTSWTAAPLYFVSPGQINVQMPFLPAGSVQLRVRTSAGVSAAATTTLFVRAPRVFTRTMDGKGEPILLHARDYSWVSQSAPAVPGEYLVLLLTGLGAVSPAADAGLPGGDNASNGPVNYLTEPAYVTFGTVETQASFAGLMPGFPGIYQVNFQVPADIPAGSQTLWVRAGGARSQLNVGAMCTRTPANGVSTVIPTSGGVASAPGITVSVPAGAFSSSATLSVARASSPTTPVDSWRASDVYTVTGLPTTLNGPVTVTLDLTRAAGDRTLIAFDTGRGVASAGLQFLEAAVNANQATVQLPSVSAGGSASAAPPESGVQSAAPRPDSSSGLEVSLYVMTFYRSTSSGDFLLFYPPGTVQESDVTAVAQVLQQAKSRLEGLGLSWAKRTRWPLRVVVYPFSSADQDKWGMAEPSVLGLNYHSISINSTKLAGGITDDLRATCGHELFHILQNLYDPRDAFRIAKFPGSWLWFDEAASTWFENKMTGQSDVPTIVRQDNYAFLTRHGLEFQPGDPAAVQAHGYGASMFLRYLEERAGGPSVVADILKQSAQRAQGVLGDSARWPVEAASSVLPGMLEEYWRNFVAAYADGSLPTGFPDHASQLGLLRERYVFADAATPGKTFSWDAPNLSAAYYLVRFQAWPANTKLEFTFTDSAGGAQFSIYRVKGDQWTLVTRTRAGTYEFSKPEDLASTGDSLLLVVANGNGSGRYTGTTPIQITINKGGDVLTYLHTMTKFGHNLYGPVTTNGSSSGSMLGPLYSLPGLTWNGTTFSATADDTALVSAGDPPYTVTVSGTVSPDGSTVTAFHFKRYRKIQRQTKDSAGNTWYLYDERIYEWDAAPLPLSYPSAITDKTSSAIYKALGPSARSLLTNFDCTSSFYNGSNPSYTPTKSSCTIDFQSSSDGISLTLSK